MGMKEKVCGACGTASGGLSILGGAQVCHSACMGLASLLSIVGITISGMPLVFLQKVAVPFWILAAIILLAMLAVHKRMGFSKKVMLANAGLIIAGTPFQAVSAFQNYLWFIGGALVVGSITWALRDRVWKSKRRTR